MARCDRSASHYLGSAPGQYVITDVGVDGEQRFLIAQRVEEALWARWSVRSCDYFSTTESSPRCPARSRMHCTSAAAAGDSVARRSKQTSALSR